MSFTPGPWDVVEREIFGRGDVEGSATIIKWDDDREGYQIIFKDVDYSDGETKANARLATAAPELLEALEKLVLFSIQKPSNAVALNYAHQVIAKARGEGV